MTDSPSASRDEPRRAYLARTVRTFLAVCFLVAAVTVLGLATLESRLFSARSWIILPTILGVSALTTGWLVNGGYERLGLNPTAAGRFGWLGFLYMPFALLPTRVVLDAFGLGYATASTIAFAAAVVAAGWLAFGTGLDRLGIETRHVGHAAVVAVVVTVGGSAIASHAIPNRLLGPASTGIAAFAAQLVVLWLGFGGYVDRLLS